MRTLRPALLFVPLCPVSAPTPSPRPVVALVAIVDLAARMALALRVGALAACPLCGVSVIDVAIDPERVCDLDGAVEVEGALVTERDEVDDLLAHCDAAHAFDPDPYKLIAFGAPRGFAERSGAYRRALLPPSRRRPRAVCVEGIVPAPITDDTEARDAERAA
jgi:hypothetical protein